MGDFSLMGWSFWEAVLAASFVGAGVGLLGGNVKQNLGVWCLTLALRMVVRNRR